MFFKRGFLRITQYSQENTCTGVFFNKVLIKLQSGSPATLFKRDSNTIVFL